MDISVLADGGLIAALGYVGRQLGVYGARLVAILARYEARQVEQLAAQNETNARLERVEGLLRGRSAGAAA